MNVVDTISTKGVGFFARVGDDHLGDRIDGEVDGRLSGNPLAQFSEQRRGIRSRTVEKGPHRIIRPLHQGD
jgi:hypothetical protein